MGETRRHIALAIMGGMASVVVVAGIPGVLIKGILLMIPCLGNVDQGQ